MTNVMQPGDMVRLAVTITDITGEPADPTELTFTMNEPDGTVTPYAWQSGAQLVRSEAGTFHVDWLIAQSGKHRYAFEATGTNAAYEAGSFNAWPRTVTAA